MNVEKISDEQIRCIVESDDIASSRVRLKDLAYGTEASKALFREILRNASYRFGFHTENEPLQIEAVPLSDERLLVVITKVSYPEELDTRFADYSDYDLEDFDGDDLDYFGSEPQLPEATLADDVITNYAKSDNKVEDKKKKQKSGTGFVPGIVPSAGVKNQDVTLPRQLKRLYRFNSIDTVIRAAHVISGYYRGRNVLYKDRDSRYHLLVCMDDHTPVEFNKICNNLAEYGVIEKLQAGTEGHMEEHYERIMGDMALQGLAKLEAL